jgi:hypothetical protein
MDKELERIWKEVVVAYVKVLPCHLPLGTQETYELNTSEIRSRSHH